MVSPLFLKSNISTRQTSHNLRAVFHNVEQQNRLMFEPVSRAIRFTDSVREELIVSEEFLFLLIKKPINDTSSV